VALGTDTGGSIRIPASYCGVVGLKATYGLVSAAGVTPLSQTLDHIGLLTASVAECIAVLPVIAEHPLDDAAPQDSYRLGVLDAQLDDPRLDPEVAAITRAAVDTLAAGGFTLASRDASVLADMGDLLGPILMVEAWQVHAAMMRERPAHFGATTRRLLAEAEQASPTARLAALERRDALLAQVEALLSGVDALVGPAVPYPAPEHTPPIDTPAGEIEGLFSGPYNVTGQPAIVIPCGMTADGLPVGLQLAGRSGGDLALLHLAAQAEAVLGAASHQ
jgi:aspartyl-tRNA(Asn)/glutamyl-tRNA(Gln) amidotransferase subunit A